MSIEVGSVVEGVVTGITNFGAFVELPGGKVGLVHISEVADVYVRDVKEFLKEQEKVKVKVLSVADMFAEAIRRVCSGESISSLYAI